jgi:hypothetical protein
MKIWDLDEELNPRLITQLMTLRTDVQVLVEQLASNVPVPDIENDLQDYECYRNRMGLRVANGYQHW